MTRSHKPQPSQKDRFIEAAREAECSEDEADFDATMKKIASQKKPAERYQPKG